MKLALVSREYPPGTAKGGLGTQTHIKAHRLAQRGHQVHVISESARASTESYADGPVKVTRIGSAHERMPVHTEPVDWLARSMAVAEWLAAQEPGTFDVIDFPEWGAEGYIYLLNRPSWVSEPRTVVHIHGPLAMFTACLGWPEPGSTFQRTGMEMEGACLRLADAVMSSSGYSAACCVRTYGISNSIPVLHTGVDTQEFQSVGVPREECPVIAFAGKLSHAKGVTVLVDACLRLLPEFPNLRVRIAGCGEPHVERELRSVAAEYPNNICLEGFIPRTHLPRFLSAADVFAVPSPCEGGPGFAWLEAMACGVPVIACSETGVSEIVQSGCNGVLVPPNNVGALAAALRKILRDADYRRSLSRGAREFAVHIGDTEHWIGRLERFYLEVNGR